MENSRYRGVFIYALMEHIHYHRVDDSGWADMEDVAEYDHDPQQIGWNVFGLDGEIDHTHLDMKEYPTINEVKSLIDKELEK